MFQVFIHYNENFLEIAPWNAIDKLGKCAGNYASDKGHQAVVDLLVDAGVKAELILGASQKLLKAAAASSSSSFSAPSADSNKETLESESTEPKTKKVKTPVEYEPCTKDDYITRHKLEYNEDGTLLLDDDGDAVMMEWERPLMQVHASIITSNMTPGKKVMNIGFGLGIIDSILQEEANPSLHIICEAHPKVQKYMLENKWDEKKNVKLLFGRWQDELPKLLKEGIKLDGIFFDTYGEDEMDEFHEIMAKLLDQPNGVYSFFNGLAPDNIFFHGVACQCMKLKLANLGIETEFVPCEIKVDESVWNGVRRKYWHGDTYYLPISTWSKEAQNSSEKA